VNYHDAIAVEFSKKDVGPNHKMGAECIKATKTWEARKDEQVQKTARDVVFEVSGTPIENVKEFLYLGRTLEENDK
jgi:hypothetical protein